MKEQFYIRYTLDHAVEQEWRATGRLYSDDPMTNKFGYAATFDGKFKLMSDMTVLDFSETSELTDFVKVRDAILLGVYIMRTVDSNEDYKILYAYHIPGNYSGLQQSVELIPLSHYEAFTTPVEAYESVLIRNDLSSNLSDELDENNRDMLLSLHMMDKHCFNDKFVYNHEISLSKSTAFFMPIKFVQEGVSEKEETVTVKTENKKKNSKVNTYKPKRSGWRAAK